MFTGLTRWAAFGLWLSLAAWFIAYLFLACLLGIAHTYLIYPALLHFWAAGRGCNARGNGNEFRQNGLSPTWPAVHLFLSAHNEAAVLPTTLAALNEQHYPGRLMMHLADDLSDDATAALLEQFCQSDRRHFHPNHRRRGKPATINQLVGRAAPGPNDILVFMDASVVPAPDAIHQLVATFNQNPSLGVADTRMLPLPTEGKGDIARYEADYIRREGRLKVLEGRRFGYIAGPFGGCWAMRARYFRPVPTNYLVDDFYLCLSAYAAGARGAVAEKAVVHEQVGGRLSREFRRKRRIGAGNWQNMSCFRDLWWPPLRDPLAFILFSHKVLRWWTPLLLCFAGACVVSLAVLSGNYWMAITFALLLVLSTRVRALNYFLAMNAALLLGLKDYLTGIRTNVWQPSRRDPERTEDDRR